MARGILSGWKARVSFIARGKTGVNTYSRALVSNESSFVGEDGEAGAKARDGVNAVGVVEEALIGEELSLSRLPLVEDALVGLDEVVDIGLAKARIGLGLAGDEAGGSSRDAGSEGDDAEEAHID